MPPSDSDQPRALELALARVAEADRRLVAVADVSYRRARSATLAGAVTIGIGAALIGTLAGASLRRRLASGLLSVALPFVASAVAAVVGKLEQTQSNEENAR
jgi:hypothetical protein